MGEMAVHSPPKKSNHRGIFFDKIYPSLLGEAVDIDFFRFQSSSYAQAWKRVA